MARLIDRVANVWRNHLERDPFGDAAMKDSSLLVERLRDGIRQDQTRHVAEQMRDNLLGQALATKTDWTLDLIGLSGSGVASVDAFYNGKLEGINNALRDVHEICPEVNASISIEDFSRIAHESAQKTWDRHHGTSLDLPALSTDGLAEKQIAHSPTIREWISDLEPEHSHDNSMGMSL